MGGEQAARMTNTPFDTTRRQVLAGLGATSALTLGGCSTLPDGSAPAGASGLLDSIAYRLLEHEP